MHETLYAEMAEVESRYWWFVAKRRIILRLLGRWVEGPATRRRIADIGCGCGALLSELAAGYEAVGVDASPEAREFCARRGLSVLDGSLPDRLPIDSGSLDAAVLSDVLEHVREDAASVAAVGGLLRPGGVLIATVPAHPWLWTRRDEFHGHVRRYTAREFRGLFPVEEWEPLLISPYNCVLFPVLAAARLGKRVLGRDEPGPDIRALPRVVNSGLRVVFEVEKYILPGMKLPVGASLIAVCRRRSRTHR